MVASEMMSMFSGSQNFISAFISAIRKSAGLGYLLMYEENRDVGLKAAFSGSSPAVAEGTRPDLHMIVEGRRIGIGDDKVNLTLRVFYQVACAPPHCFFVPPLALFMMDT